MELLELQKHLVHSQMNRGALEGNKLSLAEYRQWFVTLTQQQPLFIFAETTQGINTCLHETMWPADVSFSSFNLLY